MCTDINHYFGCRIRVAVTDASETFSIAKHFDLYSVDLELADIPRIHKDGGEVDCFIDVSAINKIDYLTCVIFMKISHVSIIMKRIRVYCSIFVGQ